MGVRWGVGEEATRIELLVRWVSCSAVPLSTPYFIFSECKINIFATPFNIKLFV